MAYDIGPKIGIDGEKEFRAQLQQINTVVKTLGTEMQAVSSQFGKQQESEEALMAKNSVLEKQIDEQKKKVEMLAQGVNNAAKKYGEADEKTMKWQQVLNKATAELNKMENELQDNTSKLGKMDEEIDDVETGFNDAGKSAVGFGEMLKAHLASSAILGVITSIKDKVIELGKAMMDYSRESENAAIKATSYFGETGEVARQTEAVIKDVFVSGMGDSLDGVADAVITVKKNLKDLSETDLTNLTKQAMGLEELYGIDMNETMRGVNALMQQFGLDAQTAMDYIVSGTQNGLDKTNELGDNLSEYAGKFAQAGYSASEYFQLLDNGLQGGAYNLDKVNDAINEVTTRISDGTIADSLSQIDEKTGKLVDGTGGWGKKVEETFQAWKDGQATQKQVVDAIVADIQSTTNQQDALNKAALAFGTMGEDGNLQFITSLTSVGNAYQDVTGKASKFYDSTTTAEQTMTSVLRSIKENMKPVGDALNELAVDILPLVAEGVETIDFVWLANGIKSFGTDFLDVLNQIREGSLTLPDIVTEVIPQMAEKGAELGMEFLTSILKKIPEILESGAQMVHGLFSGISENQDEMVEAGGKTIASLIATLSQHLPDILRAGIKLLLELIAGIIKTIPSLILAVPKITKAISEELAKYDWVSIGKNILSGIAKGLISGISVVVSAAKEAAGKIAKSFKDFFDINSPSKYMENMIGKNLMAGFAEGLTGYEGLAISAATKASKDIAGAFPNQLSVPTFSNGTAAAYNRLVSSMSNLKVVLSDGTLVGKLSPAINAQLGGYKSMEGRFGT